MLKLDIQTLVTMKLLSTLIALSLSLTALAQTNSKFPDMKTENLSHEFINLPKDVNGSHTLLCMAASKDAETEMQTWFNPLYNNFIAEPDPNNLFSFTYDVDVYFIPMFTGAKRPAYKKVMKKTEKTVRPEMKPYILFFEGTMRAYKQKLGMEDKGVPYFYFLDKDGNVIHTTTGRYTDKKMQEIINLLKPALVK